MTPTSNRSVDTTRVSRPLTTVHLPRLSTRSQLAALFLRLVVYPVIAAWTRSHRMPWPYRALDWAAIFLPARRGVRLEKVALPDCSAEWYQPRAADNTKAILYLHGGAFLTCGIRTHRRLVSRIAIEARVPALSVGYRTLPKHPIRTALEDCLSGYRELLHRGYAPEEIAIAGDSAGAHFAVMVAAIAGETGLGMPGALVCLSPLYDLAVSSRVSIDEHTGDPLFPYAALDAITAVAGRSDRTSPSAGPRQPTSPDEFDLTGFPATLIQVGTRELLGADATYLAERLADHGVRVRMETWESQFHVFQAGADLLPESRAAIARLGEFISSTLSE